MQGTATSHLLGYNCRDSMEKLRIRSISSYVRRKKKSRRGRAGLWIVETHAKLQLARDSLPPAGCKTFSTNLDK